MMFKTVLKLIFLGMLVHLSQAKVIYVDVSSQNPGKGGSWSNASVDLRSALLFAKRYDTVKVAEGIYYPGTKEEGRMAAFTLNKGVTVLGGYSTGGGERNWKKYPTVLSGDIGRDDQIRANKKKNRENNSFHIMVCPNGEDSRVDGLVFRGGYAVWPKNRRRPINGEGGRSYTWGIP